MTVPFVPGRTDATQDQTDTQSFAALEPVADGFRNYVGASADRSPETLLIDRANLLTLTAPEMTALVGGLRALGANHGDTSHGVLTHRRGVLSNDFFVNLLDTAGRSEWIAGDDGVFTARDTKTGAMQWTATRVDLLFGSHAQLRAIAQAYAADDAGPAFVTAFVSAWAKVMNLDRFDLR